MPTEKTANRRGSGEATERESLTHLTKVTLAAFSMFALTACGVLKVGPDYEEVEASVPDTWHQTATEGISDGSANLSSWWDVFEDPVLEDLIKQATVGNKDLQQAYTRILEARAGRGIATGEQFPDLDAEGSAERTRFSEGVIRETAPPQKRVDNFYSLGLDATWEVDVFGRIARNIESADASLGATIEDYRDVLVILYGEVAANYIEVRALQARIAFAVANVEAQSGTLQLTRDRLAAEISPELDVRQAELNLATTEAFVPQLEQAKVQGINRLGVLLGQPPSALHQILEVGSPIPRPPEAVAVGLPSELLRQRPDIRSAERQVAAQHAQIGVATADLYPRFSLSGSFAFATASNGIFSSGNHTWTFGPAVSWNIFDGGRVRNNVILQDSLTKELVFNYEQTVLEALEEVESSMVAYKQEQIRRDALERSVIAAEQSVELVKQLYISGLTDFQNVLDMETRLFEQQDDLAQSAGLVSQNLVSLYRALGGGWQPDPEQLEEEIQDQEENGEPLF